MVTHHASKKTSARMTRVVVAGDVCIDWLSVPVESRVSRQDESPKKDKKGKAIYTGKVKLRVVRLV
jgi:hypothetical protein